MTRQGRRSAGTILNDSESRAADHARNGPGPPNFVYFGAATAQTVTAGGRRKGAAIWDLTLGGLARS